MSVVRHPAEQKVRILFLCRRNSARSILAEALLRARFPDRYDAESAGIEPAGVHPLAVSVLDEINVSTAGLRSKHVSSLTGREFDVVATVCGTGEPTCPFFPGGRQMHRAFDDPSSAVGSDDARLASFRRVRDEIDAWIREAFAPDASPGASLD